eukprot:TRINITY_DN726_c0_g1_i1.p1 TRINITY_DN726_c0_g1~~TRINITY_DN726_c0_g1_i1.p1  ORF type:complete len:675 (+),score=360.97 TRINITY_DN726_c0_g1_i1:70-2094(+)
MKHAFGLLLLAAGAQGVYDVLEQNRRSHQRIFPDYDYNAAVKAHASGKAGSWAASGPEAAVEGAPAEAGRNPHMVPKGTSYTPEVQWLLSIFNRGWGLPGSYNDVLPNGQVYWATQGYLETGALDEHGKHCDLDSMIAAQERALTRYGLNLYDAAVWEIALSVWGRYDVAQIYERNVLYPSTTGPAGRDNGNPGGIINLRGDSDDFQYGAQKTTGSSLPKVTYPANMTHFTQDPDTGKPSKEGVKKGPGALYYRIIGPNYQMIDPMLGHFGQNWKYPWPNYDTTTKWNTYGLIHFNDWKPITGENVWSSIMGPIQSLGLASNNNLSSTTCGHPALAKPLACTFADFDHTPPSIQQAISVLPALEALQAPGGSLYHCPWGSKIFPPDPSEGENISNENNFSGYASLKMLLAVLSNYTGCGAADGMTTNDEALSYACTTTQKLVQGLDTFFDADSIISKAGEMPNGEFVVPQGGHINASGYFPVPINSQAGLAVDCQTWGMTVLGQPRLDKHFGAGTAYNIWQTTKKYAGFYKGTVIAGVGYTDLTNWNTSQPVPRNNIWSAEWTFGAINMAQVLSQQYADAGDSEKAQDLLNDAQSMYNEVTQEYSGGGGGGGGLRLPDGSYVYANMRFFIPWGWFSNPIGATCSTAWAVLQQANFNPFEYGGGNKPALVSPTNA